jgi:predicted transposase/invertase (TIGR01784 family)
MGIGIDPTVDYVFKRLCGDEDNALLLVDLLNAVLGFPAGRLVSGVTLLNPFVPKDYAEGKVSVLDVRARDDPGRQFLLEMQRFAPPALAERLLYYWAGGHADQLLKGDRYELLQPTYSICFLGEPLVPDAFYHHRFRAYDEEHGVVLGRGFEVRLLELSKFDLPAEALTTPLERWCYFFKQGASLEPGNLPAALDVPVMRRAVEVLVKISQSELERQRYLERQRAERDAANIVETARVALEELRAAQENAKAAQEELRAAWESAKAAQESAKVAQEGAEAERQLGFHEGRGRGTEEGIRIGRIQVLQQLLGLPEAPREELAQLSEQSLGQLEDSLKRQLGGPKPANGTAPPNQT